MASVNNLNSLIEAILNQNKSSVNNISCLDTRDDKIDPNSLLPMLRVDFKSKDICGLNDTYSGILTFRPYGSTGDWTGGPAHQIGFDGANGLYHRYSTVDTSWSGWKKCWLQGDRITNAVWNDYAEMFERGENTEVGDIIALDENSESEKYIKSWEGCTSIVGVHSDTYGILIGGKEVLNNTEFISENINDFIPVGLVGRVKTKVIGKVRKGDRIVPSKIRGVGRKYNPMLDEVLSIVGIVVENKETEDISLVKIFIK